MLNNVVNQKLHKGRRKSTKGKGQKTRAIKDPILEGTDENRKITEFFPRTIRKTEAQKKKEECDILKEKILKCANEEHLEIYYDEIKGRGIKSKTEFAKGEFVVEYKGELICDRKQIADLEDLYNEDPTRYGSYVYYFKHADKNFCVDATRETTYKGRLINHSRLRPNLQTKSVDFGSRPFLILVATMEIKPGDELLYDYGEKDSVKIKNMPWLANT